jgi:hypothetical protein
MIYNLSRAAICGLCMLALASAPAHATTKGLNQIVTPDIQPLGMLSISAQGQNRAIANPEEMQFEIGLTKEFEIAEFQGFSPGESIFAAELGIVQRKSFLLSTGVLGVQKGQKPQPFLEAGYYTGKLGIMAGIQTEGSDGFAILGAEYQLTPKVLLTSDYISGLANFATAGVTIEITPHLSFNPAVYISNSSPHKAFGYGVLTWNIKAW